MSRQHDTCREKRVCRFEYRSMIGELMTSRSDRDDNGNLSLKKKVHSDMVKTNNGKIILLSESCQYSMHVKSSMNYCEEKIPMGLLQECKMTLTSNAVGLFEKLESRVDTICFCLCKTEFKMTLPHILGPNSSRQMCHF